MQLPGRHRGRFAVFVFLVLVLPLHLFAASAVFFCELGSSDFPVTVRLKMMHGSAAEREATSQAIASRLRAKQISASVVEETVYVVIQSALQIPVLREHGLDSWGTRAVEPSIVDNPRRWDTLSQEELIRDLEREYRTFLTAHGILRMRERALPPQWAIMFLASTEFNRSPWAVLRILETKYAGLLKPIAFVDPELGFLNHLVLTGGLPSPAVRQRLAEFGRVHRVSLNRDQRHAGIVVRAIGVEVTSFFQSEVISRTISPQGVEDVVTVLRERVLNDPLFLADPQEYLEQWRLAYRRTPIINAPESRALAVLTKLEADRRLIDFAQRMREARDAGYLPLRQGTAFVSLRWTANAPSE